jgi:hypothetical protein
MNYTTRDQVEGMIGAKINLSAAQWSAILMQADLWVEAVMGTSYIDDTIHVVDKEVHYDVTEEFRLHENGVVMVDLITVQFRDVTGWAEHMIEPMAYKWFNDGLVLIGSPFVYYTPNIFQVSYRYKQAKADIPRFVQGAATFMAASIVLSQPKAIITPETITELAALFGGDIDKIKSVSIEGISVSFDAPSVKDVLTQMMKTMADNSKSYKEQAFTTLQAGRFRPRFN